MAEIDNNIRVTKAELDRMNRTSIQLADGSGDYLAALDVYHHLHCLVSALSNRSGAFLTMSENDTTLHISRILRHAKVAYGGYC
jgi:hypothetical protein